MSAETEYQRMRREAAEQRALSEKSAHSPRPYRLPPEVAKERAAERNRRNMEAKRRALMVLASRYPNEFEKLKDAELAAIHAEKGPLPGDDASVSSPDSA